MISDDDGYPETMRFAQILHQYGFIGTYNIPTQSAMTADAIRALEQGGGEICGHTVDHANLAKLDWNGQYHEIADNKSYLEKTLGHPLRCFAYPYGAYNSNTVLRQAVGKLQPRKRGFRGVRPGSFSSGRSGRRRWIVSDHLAAVPTRVRCRSV